MHAVINTQKGKPKIWDEKGTKFDKLSDILLYIINNYKETFPKNDL